MLSLHFIGRRGPCSTRNGYCVAWTPPDQYPLRKIPGEESSVIGSSSLLLPSQKVPPTVHHVGGTTKNIITIYITIITQNIAPFLTKRRRGKNPGRTKN